MVLASAGSGKTLSLMAKINYLINGLHITPPQILVISFTNKTVSELVERCGNPDVEVRTFHSLGNSLLQFSNRETLRKMRLISDDAIRAFVRRTIWHFCCESETFARHFNDYLLFFYSAPQSVGSLRNHAERVRFNQLYMRPPICSHGGRMRSKEEELLANWLAIHRIQYNYSEPFRGNSDYRPTFSIRSGTNVAYIDILQTDKGGGSFYGLSYLKTCVLRKRIHQRSQTNYLQISTHD